ncbi:MAG: fatty acid hydroxylase, partial [Polynucleobacter sp.]
MSLVDADLAINRWYGEVHESLYRYVVEPILFQFNWIGLAEDAYDGVEWFMLGVLQIAIIVLVLRTWERVNPAENQGAHAKAKWPDVAYTLFHRLGFFQVFIFFAFSGLFFQMQSVL